MFEKYIKIDMTVIL